MSEPCPNEHALLQLVRGELAADAVDGLLLHTDACENCALVVAEAGLAISAEAGDEVGLKQASDARGLFAPGELIACRYRIQARVGRGGMGEVFSATDEELGERIALKTIAPALASDPLLVEHFKRELRLARKVSHPNVCRTLEFGRHDLEAGTSQCFFTMQFIEGVTLRRRLLEGGALELSVALGMVRDLALGLRAIHEQNIVHRDIKPDNIMLTSGLENGALVPLWLDFGVARVDLRESASLGVLAGTPDYAAPELLQGKVASHASDLYALGLVLYEVLVGDLPFSHVRSFSEAAQRQYLVPAAPSTVRTDLPASLDQLVLECLATSPQDRPPSAAQVADRLGWIRAELSDSHPMLAAPGAPAPKGAAAPVQQKAPKRRWLWLAAAAAVSALLGATFAKTRPSRAPVASSQGQQRQPSSSPLVALPKAQPDVTPSGLPLAAAPPAASAVAAARPKAARSKAAETPRTPSTPTASSAQPHAVSDFGGRR
ncbi:MAG TPA: serine/threonine-protein kinase [Polyangiaceae bacterium]|nr:serine/threonine-protein kinase [Polyangiaceae bacterium]